MDTKTVKAELVKALDDAIVDEDSAARTYRANLKGFMDLYASYPEGTAPIGLSDVLYIQGRVGRIADAELEHRQILLGIRDRIKALPDG